MAQELLNLINRNFTGQTRFRAGDADVEKSQRVHPQVRKFAQKRERLYRSPQGFAYLLNSFRHAIA